MLVTAVTTTAVAAAAAGPGFGATLGGLALAVLVLALIAKEIVQYVGHSRWLPLQRALTMAILPLSVAVGFAIVQQLVTVV